MDEKIPRNIGQNLAATIVSSYVKHNKVSANDLPTIIASVHRALSGVGKPASPAEPVTPAVPVRQSVRPDYVVCLECGFRSQMLRRHLRLQHGLDRAAYFARWRLPPRSPNHGSELFGKALGGGQAARARPRPTSSQDRSACRTGTCSVSQVATPGTFKGGRGTCDVDSSM